MAKDDEWADTETARLAHAYWTTATEKAKSSEMRWTKKIKAKNEVGRHTRHGMEWNGTSKGHNWHITLAVSLSVVSVISQAFRCHALVYSFIHSFSWSHRVQFRSIYISCKIEINAIEYMCSIILFLTHFLRWLCAMCVCVCITWNCIRTVMYILSLIGGSDSNKRHREKKMDERNNKKYSLYLAHFIRFISAD